MELLNDSGKLFEKRPVADAENETGIDCAESSLHLRSCPFESVDSANESDSDDDDRMKVAVT